MPESVHEHHRNTEPRFRHTECRRIDFQQQRQQRMSMTSSRRGHTSNKCNVKIRAATLKRHNKCRGHYVIVRQLPTLLVEGKDVFNDGGPYYNRDECAYVYPLPRLPPQQTPGYQSYGSSQGSQLKDSTSPTTEGDDSSLDTRDTRCSTGCYVRGSTF